MSNEKQFWVIVEHTEGNVKAATFGIINAAISIAEKCGGRVTALYLTDNENIETKELIRSGANRVIVLVNDHLNSFTYSAYTDALLPLIRKELPYLLMLSAGNHGKELAPALAASLCSGQATDCISLEMNGKGINVKRPVYANTAHSTLEFTSPGQNIVTIRPGMYRGRTPDSALTGNVETLKIDLPDNSFMLKVKEVIKEAGKGVDLTEARIVVAGGMGMKKPENFKLIEDLAQLLGAGIGASRPVVDYGWVSYSNQVGMSGRIISPDLYIACGISGTVQHLAGMSSCKCIVAINTDPAAPIFSVADFGIVGDAMEVLPVLTEEFRKVLSS